MIRPRTSLLALAPVLLHALAREADRGLGLVLRAEVAPQDLLVEVGRAMGAEATGAVVRVSSWLVAGVVAWLALAAWRRRREGTAWAHALADETTFFTPLLLRPALTLVALSSVATRASFPYAFTLPVALTQDWALGQDAVVLAALLAWRLPAVRLPAPRAGEVFTLAFLAYALLAPDWAWRWEGHPGNEPKYLRQAVALGHGLTFDAEGVTAAMEDLPTLPLAESVASAAGGIARESGSMAVALARGDAGRAAIRATRITRQTVRGKKGGVFYVLAPGPSLMLAPALRVDRAINLARGQPGRVAVSVLGWCALAALLVMALFLLGRDATGRPGLAAALAFGFAVVPPFLFYSFQFYPEMVGALVMALAFRTLALRPVGLRRHPWLMGGLLATLPWLHQKFLVVWLVLVATALWVGWRDRTAAPPDDGSRGRSPWWWAVGLVVPTLVGLYLTALYNFSITGSVRPDALFLAWGPGGVTSARVGQGVLGLLLDARYGILPYVPVLLLAAGGLALGGARRFAVVLPAAAAYYLTVAAADNWAGAVCNLGRYFMPVAPLAVALVAIAIDRVLPRDAGVGNADPSGPVQLGSLGTTARRGALALVLMLAAWTGLFAISLWRDPHAANDSALLLAKSTYADGHLYIPDLFIRRWADGAPGLGARIVVWLAGVGAVAGWLGSAGRSMRFGRGRRGCSPIVTLATVATLIMAAGLFLERWPGKRGAPSFAGRMTGVAIPSSAVFVSGAARVREDEAVLGPGRVELLLRAPLPASSLGVTVGGQGGVLRAAGLAPIVLRSTGGRLDLPLVPYHEVRGRDGRRVAYSRTSLSLDGEAVLRLTEGPAGPSASGPAGSSAAEREKGNGTAGEAGSLSQDSE